MKDAIQIAKLKLQKNLLKYRLLKNNSSFSSSKRSKLILLTLAFCISIAAYGFGVVNAQDEDECQANKAITCDVSLYKFNPQSTNSTMTHVNNIILGGEAKPVDGGVAFVPYENGGGAFPTLARATGKMYLDSPVSTQQYLAYLSDKSGIQLSPQPAYAVTNATQGFNILNPIIKLWEWSRNLVYVFYVVIFIVIGIMIIMRQRIGGQIPITIINSIPNVVISLVLVTFSYAISGLIIDLMHLATGVIHYGLFMAGNSPGAGMETDTSALKYIFQSSEMSVFKIFGTAGVSNFDTAFTLDDVEGFAGNFMVKTVVNIIEDLAQWDTLVSVVLSIAGVSAMFKLFFTLLTHYLTFMLYPVVAPFQFLIGSLPGKTDQIWSWFKKMFESTGAFIGVYAAFCLMIIIVQSPNLGDWTWFPPLSGFTATTETIKHLLGYALFITTPTIPSMISEVMQIKPGPSAGVLGAETLKATSKLPVIGGLLG